MKVAAAGLGGQNRVIEMRRPGHGKLGAAALIAIGLVTSVLLGRTSIDANLERTCTVRDTPYLDLCPPVSDGSPEATAQLRRHLAANPGDSNAYVKLAFADTSLGRPQLIAAASTLAPSNPTLMALRASEAIARQDLKQAAALLVALVEHHNHAPSMTGLAQYVATGRWELLRPHLAPGKLWLTRMLSRMGGAELPFSTALPLIAEAVQTKAMTEAQVRPYIRQLKAGGAWADAYGLWLTLHGKPLPVLYNGSFDLPFDPDGFDWEVAAIKPSRAGAVVERPRHHARGSVLDIQLTGRTFPSPLVRQQLFIGQGRYRLSAEYMGRQLRADQGVVWTMRCGGNVEAGRSPVLADTGGAWQPFTFDFTVPPACGLVTNLQLEPSMASQAAAGARGRIAFDAFALERVMP